MNTNHLNHLIAFGLAALVLVASGCSREGDDSESTEANATESEYAFNLWGKKSDGTYDEGDRIDAMGVALSSTALTNRDRKNANGVLTDESAGEYNENKYQDATPQVAIFLPTFAHYLAKMHKAWDKQLADVGFEPCSTQTLFEAKTIAKETVQVLPCTLQKLGTNATTVWDGKDAKIEGPRVLDVVLPDYVTLNVDLPLGFPNGRILDEQVNDSVLAMGFLKMGGDCRGDISGKAKVRPYKNGEKHVIGKNGQDLNGVPLCNVETFKNFELNPTKNDRNNGEFNKDFPYLVSPWFYEEEPGHSYWPTTKRRSAP